MNAQRPYIITANHRYSNKTRMAVPCFVKCYGQKNDRSTKENSDDIAVAEEEPLRDATFLNGHSVKLKLTS